MAVTNTWVIEQMDCYPTYESQTDVVFTVHWRINATDGTYASTVYSAQAVSYTGGSAFTPYADLTQEQVVGWVEAALGPEQVAVYYNFLATNIANQANPPVVAPPLPWATTAQV
jgi:hypothetical protein